MATDKWESVRDGIECTCDGSAVDCEHGNAPFSGCHRDCSEECGCGCAGVCSCHCETCAPLKAYRFKPTRHQWNDCVELLTGDRVAGRIFTRGVVPLDVITIAQRWASGRDITSPAWSIAHITVCWRA